MYGASMYGDTVGVVPAGAQGMVVNHGGLVSNYGGNVQNMQVMDTLQGMYLHIASGRRTGEGVRMRDVGRIKGIWSVRALWSSG